MKNDSRYTVHDNFKIVKLNVGKLNHNQSVSVMDNLSQKLAPLYGSVTVEYDEVEETMIITLTPVVTDFVH